MSWQMAASCTQIPVIEADSVFFAPEGESRKAQRRREQMAARICMDCPVQKECLQYTMQHEGSLERGHRAGTSGGLSHNERVYLAELAGIVRGDANNARSLDRDREILGRLNSLPTQFVADMLKAPVLDVARFRKTGVWQCGSIERARQGNAMVPAFTCDRCGQRMRKRDEPLKENPGTVRFGARGLCDHCYRNAIQMGQITTRKKPLRPTNCVTCKTALRPRGANAPAHTDTVEHHGHGKCVKCYSADLRQAA